MGLFFFFVGGSSNFNQRINSIMVLWCVCLLKTDSSISCKSISRYDKITATVKRVTYMNDTARWLINADPWVEYNARVHLLGQDTHDTDVLQARGKTLSNPRIQALLSDFGNWNDEIVSSHKSAGLLLHKLSFLADIGLTAQDSAIGEICACILSHRTQEGVVQVPINVPVHFGGTGLNT